MKKSIFDYLRFLLGERKKEKSTGVQLNNEDIEMLRFRLADLMDHKRPFLQKGYHIKDMASDIQVPVHQLSAFINQVIGMHYSDYMNSHRIKYCENLIGTELTSKPDLNDLADKSGFSNRNSFTTAFKKFTGQKPFEYIKHRYTRISQG